MADVAVGNRYRVTVWCQAGDQAGLNVRHIEITGVNLGPYSEKTVANELHTELGIAYAAVMGTAAQMRGIILQRLAITPTPAPVYSDVPAISGIQGGELLPRQVCGLITLRSALAGRANRGRVYVPFPREADADEFAGKTGPTADYQERLKDVAVYWTGAITLFPDGPAEPGYVQYSNVLLPTGGGAAVPLTSAVVRPNWATQRRRGNYGRPNTPPF